MAATFVVETGAGIAGANSYVSEADALQIIENLETAANVTLWSGYTDDQRKAALRDATAFQDQRFGTLWLGVKSNADNPLDWPRYDLETRDGYRLDANEVPEKVKACTSLLAVKSAAGTDLWADLTAPVGGVKSKKVKAGPVMTETVYAGSASTRRSFPRAIAMLDDFVLSGSGVRRS